MVGELVLNSRGELVELIQWMHANITDIARIYPSKVDCDDAGATVFVVDGNEQTQKFFLGYGEKFSDITLVRNA